MSTRSEIAVEYSDGSIKSIYCHSDGYLSYNGVILNENYDTLELANSIIEQGDCSILKQTIDESRFYNTWRNENTKAKTFVNEYDFMSHFANDIFAEYIYLFKNGKWLVSSLEFLDNPNDNYTHCIGYHTKLLILEEALIIRLGGRDDKPYFNQEVQSWRFGKNLTKALNK